MIRASSVLAWALGALLVGLAAFASGACAADAPSPESLSAAADTHSSIATIEVTGDQQPGLDAVPAAPDQPAPDDGSTAAAADQPLSPVEIAYPGGTRAVPVGFHSATLGLDTWYYVALPPGYDSGDQRYPVLYMLHGAYGGASEWVEIGLPAAADELWTQGDLGPFIIVLPEGSASYYLNHANGGPRWGDYIAGDVVQEIDSHFRTVDDPSQRAIGGLSMGGDGALQLALHHPDIFGIVGAHSPTTRLSYEQIPGPFYGDFEYWQENNPLWLIEHTDAAAALKIWIDMGRLDVWLPSAEALHRVLLEQGVEHQYAILEGSHEAEYWEAYQSDYLRFYGQAFADVARRPADPTIAVDRPS